MEHITLDDIISCKRVSDDILKKDIESLIHYTAEENKQKLCGSKFLHHYQLHNLLDTRTSRHPLLKDILNNDKLKSDILEQVKKRNKACSLPLRVFECYRVNCGSVVFFRPSVAKYIYKLLNATYVLDPCAGWGGRMLGAVSLGIRYTGIDTNINMRESYNNMLSKLVELGYDTTHINMIWKSWKDIEFTDYDCVLTSPPYYNTEIYPNMTAFKDEDEYYKDFLIQMIDKCRKHISKNGNVCINVSQKIYDKLIIKYKYEQCDCLIEMPKNVISEKKKEYIYVWNK